VPARFVFMLIVVATLQSLDAPCFAQPIAGGARAESQRLEPDQQRRLDHLLEDLRDSNLSLDRRQRAAAILLADAWPAAIAAMKHTLAHATDPAARRAIARAVSRADQPDPALIEPLMKMLGSEDVPLRQDVAAGLARFDDDQLVQRLHDIALDEDETVTRRLGAIDALAEHRNPFIVSGLIKLTRNTRQTIRDAAFESLEQLTGLTDIARDPDAWQRWWVRNGKLPSKRWLAMLMQNLSAQSDDLDRQLAKRTQRLTQTYNNLYDATDEKGRGSILQQMLDDELIELRLLSLQLIERRVLNAQPITDEVRTAMRQRLDDPDHRVRARSATLLENIADADGAARVVELLLAESDARVQSAYLALLARVPQADAVNPALLLLQRPNVRSAAASFLVAAAGEDMLTGSQVDSALTVAREHIQNADTVEPAVVRLIGRLGVESDQPTLVKLLGHDELPVRLAAVNAFAQSRWPVGPLLEHLGDAAIQPAVIQVISQRGESAETLIALLDAEPDDADLQAKWLAAAQAVAGRLTAEALVQVDEHLAAQADRVELHEQILTAASNHAATNGNGETAAPSPQVDARRVEALFRLAGLYMRTDQSAKAKPIHQRLADRSDLSADHQVRLAAGQLKLQLDEGQYDQAAVLTRKHLESGAMNVDTLAAPWLSAAESAVADEQITAATTLTKHCTDLFSDKLSQSAAARLTALKTQLTPDEEPTSRTTTTADAPTPTD